jgi:hypothetical protein
MSPRWNGLNGFSSNSCFNRGPTLYSLLFDPASETLIRFGRERFAVEMGVTALLHTWGQNLMDHPHLHCLVTGGGLQTASAGSHRWVGPSQQRYLFPVQAVAAMFAGKFIDRLQDLRRRGKLTHDGTLAGWKSDAGWQAMIVTLRSRKWIVFGKGSVNHDPVRGRVPPPTFPARPSPGI